MSSNTVRQLLETRLNSEWGASTVIFWDDSNKVPKTGVPYIRCTLDGIDSENLSITCVRDFDLLTIQVFTPKGAGAGANLLLCDELVRIFRNYAISTLLCFKVVNERVGNYKEWYQRNVIIDVQTDTHTP